MTSKEARVRWEAEKAKLMQAWLKLPLGQRKDMIFQASKYRSGEDSCNSVYMGSLATSQLFLILGGSMFKDSLAALLVNASEDKVNKALEVAAPYIDAMVKHPVKKCPCCGQIISGRV